MPISQKPRKKAITNPKIRTAAEIRAREINAIATTISLQSIRDRLGWTKSNLDNKEIK